MNSFNLSDQSPSESEINFNKYLSAGKNVTRILDNILKGYDKRLRPEYSGPAVNVGITSKNLIYIELYKFN